jgi:hypothetical protein
MRVPRGRVVQALTSGLDILAGTLGGVASGKQRRRPQQGGDGKGEGEFLRILRIPFLNSMARTPARR